VFSLAESDDSRMAQAIPLPESVGFSLSFSTGDTPPDQL